MTRSAVRDAHPANADAARAPPLRATANTNTLVMRAQERPRLRVRVCAWVRVHFYLSTMIRTPWKSDSLDSRAHTSIDLPFSSFRASVFQEISRSIAEGENDLSFFFIPVPPPPRAVRCLSDEI